MGLRETALDRKIHIALITAAGFALTVGLYQGIIAHLVGPRSEALKIAYAFEDIWEAGFFGFGFAFLILYGTGLRKLDPGPVRNRCIGIWIAISYFFMSWWPHASAHQFLTPLLPTDFIILEVCLHWPNLAAALVLCYYQLDVLFISYSIAVNNKELRGWSDADLLPVPWYKNIKLHGIVISMLAAAGWIGFAWKYDPIPPFVLPWQHAMLWTIYVCDGGAAGMSLGFAYSAARLVHRLPKRRTRIIAAISIGAIAFVLCSALPHAVAHFNTAPFPEQVIVIEYTFHLSITGAVAILAYYQHKFLVLALAGRMNLMMKFKNTDIDENMTSETLRGNSKGSSGMGNSSAIEMDDSSTLE
jgi:hypothetical protein